MAADDTHRYRRSADGAAVEPQGDPPGAQDSDLVAALARGEPEALGILYERHGATILRVLRRYTRGLADTDLEDLRQEVFLTALDAAPRYRQTGSVRSWLCGIAVQLGRNRSRRSLWRRGLVERFGGLSTGVAKTVSDPVEGVVGSRLEAERALRVLPAAQREVLLLHVVEELSGPEIATALGINEKTVWTRLHRARKAMREALAEGEGS